MFNLADLYCGCNPEGLERCPEAKSLPRYLLEGHLRAAEVCLGRQTIRSYDDIPQVPKSRYEIHQEWGNLENFILDYQENDGLDLLPDFQRGHVWTSLQQQAYVEAMLAGSEVSRHILFNHVYWDRSDRPIPAPKGTMTIVDGLQRVEAVRRFLRGDLKAFGLSRSQLGPGRASGAYFKIRIMQLDRAAVLRVYLAINGGGTPHSQQELSRVRVLLDRAQAAQPPSE